MDAVEAPYSSPVSPPSLDPKSHNYIIDAYTSGLDYPKNSYLTGTRDSPPTLGRHWQKNWALHGTYQWHITLRQMDSRKGRTNGWSNTSAWSQPIRTTGPQCCPSPRWYTIMQR